MGYTYCTKLASNNSTSIDPSYGFPFAGYVNFTDYDAENPFEASEDYLQRWDVGSGMFDIDQEKEGAICSEDNGTCVKINDMYCSTANEFKYRNQESFDGNNNKCFLSMVPLSRNINSNGRGLSFFMDMESEIKTEKNIELPYNSNKEVQICNLDFCAAGFCKSNIPYIGLEYVSRMINSNLDNVEDNNEYYKLYSSTVRTDMFGKSESSTLVVSSSNNQPVKTYEFPGAGKLLLSPLAVCYYNNSSNENLSDLISNSYCGTDDSYIGCLVHKLCLIIIKAIGFILKSDINFYTNSQTQIKKVIDEDSYVITFGYSVDGDEQNKIKSYLNLLSQSGEIYYKSNSGSFDKAQDPFNLKVEFTSGVYFSHSVNIGDLQNSKCSLYGESLQYYLDRGEKIKNGNDEYTGDGFKNRITNGTYFFVIRSITNMLLSNHGDLFDCSVCAATNTYLEKCNSSISTGALYNRMDLYPNTSGVMKFLDRDLNSNDYVDSSTFKPRTLQYQTNDSSYYYSNCIPAFNGTPAWNNEEDKLTNMGVIEEDVEIKFNGNIYVSEVTLVFEGETIQNLSSTISVGEVKKDTKNGSVNPQTRNTEFVFEFSSNNSPAKISSYLGKAINHNMNVRTVSAQQMLKYCSFPGYDASANTTFDNIYRLDRNTDAHSSGTSINPEDSQMTFTKITGRIPVSITGSGLYKNDNTNAKLISAYLKITDESSLDVSVYTLGIDDSSGYCPSTGLLYWKGNSFNFVLPASTLLNYTIYRPFLGSMSGDIPRYTGNNGDSSLYNMGVSSFTSEDDLYKSKIGLDSSNNVICVGPNYRDSSANGGTLTTFSNSKYSTYVSEDTSVFNKLTYDLGLENADKTTVAYGTRGTSVGANSVYYSINDNYFTSDSSTISEQLNENTNSYIELSLPEPHLDVTLVYDSVEFNRASAWTFMRSMPLNPGSETAPHILIYKVEAWITGSDTNDLDSSATNSMHFDHNNSYIYSGYSDSSNEKDSKDPDHHFCVMGINEAIEDTSILNNCYLKVDDGGNTEELNAVGTAFPIIDITAANVKEMNTVGTEDSSHIIGDITAENTSFCDYYGAPALNVVIYENDANFGDNIDINNDDEIYNKLYDLAKTRLKEESDPSNDNGAQVVVFPYCYPGLKPSSTGFGDDRKVIYICVGFYNNREEMIPINGKFGITYDVKVGDVTTSYTKYMYLSQFFPKDSMIYLAGKDYKKKTEAEENNKLSFVTTGMNIKYVQLEGDGLYSTYIPETDEIVNIGPSSGITDASISYEISPSSKSTTGHGGNTSDDSVSPEYAGHYGILNRYSGKVSFVSNVPYDRYKDYTDSLQGKCLLKQEHICYFPNKTGVVTLL